MKSRILTVFSILILSASIFGQINSAQTDVESMCNVSAYIIDKDPKGLNVRSKPNGKSKKLGAIPFDKDGTMVTIIASAGSWVKIESAWNMEEKTVFSKTGWVYAPLLAISTAKRSGEAEFVKAYEMPSRGNDVIAELPFFTEYKLAGCFEGWMKITIPQKDKNIIGWIEAEDQCDLANTNCG